MPIWTCTAADAYARTKANKLATYPHPKHSKERLVPYARVAHSAGFSFSRDTPIYAIGSCFARNIERRLQELGFQVASLAEPDSELAQVLNGRSFFNKYPPPAIEQEVAWALDPECPFPAPDAFLQVTKDHYVDPHLGGKVRGSIEELTSLRRAYDAHLARLKQCPVVIMTLGLVECWFDKQLGVFLNLAPPPGAVERAPERFEFQLLGHEDVLRSLERTYSLLKQHGHPDCKLLLTVSPVPLARTFTEQDVLQASCYSKSVLRAAAEAFAIGKPDVSYFPSYEMVTLADRATAWDGADYRHVSADMVSRIMSHVMNSYLPEPLAPETVAEARLLYRAGEYTEALALLEPLVGDSNADFKLVWLTALALKRLERTEEALEYMERAASLDRSKKDVPKQRAQLLRQLGREQEAKDVLAAAGIVEKRSRKKVPAEAVAVEKPLETDVPAGAAVAEKPLEPDVPAGVTVARPLDQDLPGRAATAERPLEKEVTVDEASQQS